MTTNPQGENSLNLNVLKLRENVVLPTRAHDTDAGTDIYYNPETEDSIFLEPGQSHLFQTGISVEFDPQYVLEIKNRSSVASKLNLVVGACVVDAGYRGEIFVNLINVGSKSQIITPRQKIAQFVIYRVESPQLNIVDNLSNSSRGGGGFGSSGS
jgi:dUTP pyrophosphatase